MKNILLTLAAALITAGCVGSGSSSNPTISASTVGNPCTNMTNNATCTIQLTFNPGDNTNPVLGSNIGNPLFESPYPGITASGAFESSLISCQNQINNTPKNTTNSCLFNFTYTTQGGDGTNIDLIFNLNGINANGIPVSGN